MQTNEMLSGISFFIKKKTQPTTGQVLEMQQTTMLAFEEGGLRKRPLGSLLHREAIEAQMPYCGT